MTQVKRILVADDSKMTREMLRILLVRAGYEVIMAEDGQQTIEMALSEKPDLVLSDGLLPKMHGFMVCRAIKELPCPPKVVLLTGVYTKPNYKWEAKLDFGADDLLTKPFKPDELLACISRQLGHTPTHRISSEHSDMFEEPTHALPTMEVDPAVLGEADAMGTIGSFATLADAQ